MNVTPHILMCPPDHYGIEYEINPWMSRSRQADRELAQQQWSRSDAMLERVGAQISLLEPVAGLARSGLHGQCGDDLWQAGDSRPLPPRATARRGAAVRALVDRARLHGRAPARRAVFRRGRRRSLLRRDAGRRLSHSQRRAQPATGRQAARQPGDAAGTGRHALLSPRHLLLPTRAGRRRIWFPGAFDDYGRAAPRRGGATLIQVSADEAHSFACNAVVVGGKHCRHQHRLPAAAPRSAGGGIHAARNAAERIRQSRRQREVPDVAARWRRSGRVENIACRLVPEFGVAGFSDGRQPAETTILRLPRCDRDGFRRSRNCKSWRSTSGPETQLMLSRD